MTNTTPADLPWQPPKRLEWVEAVNAAGRGLDIRSIVPLDAENLLATAIKNTGLSDFGSDDWREPFHILVKSVDEEADLNLLGRIMTRSDILRVLQSRLQVEDVYKRHPEISEQVIKAPLIITGLARTGTSALLNVLASDPQNQAPLCWEAWMPCPPPEDATYATDPRIEKADRMAKLWSDILPEWTTIHDVRGHLPVEDNFLHELSFRSRVLVWYGKAPSYMQWAGTADMKPAMDYMVRVLKLLQWKHKRQRWIIKSPALSVPLDLIFQTFPDAQMVYTHRDPVMAIQSGIHIINSTYWIRSDNYLLHRDLCDFVTSPEVIAGATNQNLDLIQSDAVPNQQILHVQYRDFVRDNVKTVENIYEYFGIDFPEASREAVARYADENAKARTAMIPYTYNKASPEKAARIRELFKRYQDYIGVASD